jgi:hypothetical protein
MEREGIALEAALDSQQITRNLLVVERAIVCANVSRNGGHKAVASWTSGFGAFESLTHFTSGT